MLPYRTVREESSDEEDEAGEEDRRTARSRAAEGCAVDGRESSWIGADVEAERRVKWQIRKGMVLSLCI